MGLFDRFRGPKRTCEDPVFGHLVYDNQSSWNGNVLFGPTANQIAVAIVTGGPDGRYTSGALPRAQRAIWGAAASRC